MNTPEMIMVITITAILVERIVEYISQPFPSIPKYGKLVLSLVLGILFAVFLQLDVFVLLGVEPVSPYAGQVLTGLVFAGGSNLVNDILKRVGVKL
jgi:hypothetical protein